MHSPKIMLLRFALCCVFPIALSIGLRAAEVTEIVFRATVEKVENLSRYSGTVIPVHFYPLFVVSLKIEDCEQDIGGKKSGETVVLAIHSPTHLFRLEDPQGQKFLFTLGARAPKRHYSVQ
jgi:hypothetical protein